MDSDVESEGSLSLFSYQIYFFLYDKNQFVYVDDSMDDIGEIPILLEWNNEFQFCWNGITNSNSVGIIEVDAWRIDNKSESDYKQHYSFRIY